MTSKTLTLQQAVVRKSLLYRLAQRAETSALCGPMRPGDSGRAGSMDVVSTIAEQPMAVFRGKAKAVTPAEKKRFYATARNPKNKDRKDYPLVVVF